MLFQDIGKYRVNRIKITINDYKSLMISVNMGRWGYSNKTEADDLKKLEIWWLKEYGYLNGYKSGGMEWKSGWNGAESSVGFFVITSYGENYINFQYSQTDQSGTKESFDYKVQLVTTPCHFGGHRYWFICPLIINGRFCGRRIGVLYKNGKYFGCRHCHNLFYSSQNYNRRSKNHHFLHLLTQTMKADKIRDGMKHRFYAGRPTKRLRKLMQLNQSLGSYMRLQDSKK